MQAQSTNRRVKVGNNLYQRGSRYYLIVKLDGHQIVEPIRATNLKEAKTARDERLAVLRRGGLAAVGDRSLTFESLAQKFVEHEEGPSGRLKPSTLELRRILLTKHAVPVLGKRRAADLTPAHIRSLIDSLTRKGLSGSSVRGVVASVSCVLDHGVRTEVVPRNVCRDLTRGDLPSSKRTTEPRYLRISEVRLLLDALGDEFRPLAATCFYGGLRVSEALALRWEHVKFDDGLIEVPGTKSSASAAPVPLLPELAEELRAHRERQGTFGFDRIAQDALVFTTATGKPQNRRNALRAVNTASKRVGLWSDEDGREPVGLHDLRHSLANYALKERGLRTVDVSRLLRHSNVAITETTYIGLVGTKTEQAHELGLALAGGARS